MTDKEFDKRVKSLLADAGERVPDGAWDAIRARIPARTVKSAAHWWWAGAGLAAAAALALAFVLGGTFRSDPSVVTAGEGPAVAQVVGAEVKQAPEVQVEKKAAEAKEAPQQAPAAKKGTGIAVKPVKRAAPVTVKTKSLPDGSQSATTAPASPAPEASSPAQGVESATTKSAPAAKTAAKEAGQTQVSEKPAQGGSDPFARLAWEDAHQKTRRGISLDVNGIVGTNDKATSVLRGGMMAAPAKAQSETGKTTYITEEGESCYGIPLSFGLGVKFYLS